MDIRVAHLQQKEKCLIAGALVEETCRKKGHEIEQREELHESLVQKSDGWFAPLRSFMQEISA